MKQSRVNIILFVFLIASPTIQMGEGLKTALFALPVFLGGLVLRKVFSSKSKKEITWENDKEWENRFF